MRCKRIGDEFFRSQRGARVVANAHAMAAQQQFARDADRDRLQVAVHDVGLSIGHWFADGDQAADVRVQAVQAHLWGADREQGGTGMRLGRAEGMLL